MTKLTPMLKLLKDAGAEGFANTVMIEIGALEQLRQAIISDFGKSREPVLHVTKHMACDYDLKELTPLYDLPEWRDK